MSNQYAETFELRGHPYDEAMQKFPCSRDQEFMTLFECIDLTGVNRVLDLPSGGGYLEKYLPSNSQLDCADPSTPFQTSDAIFPIDLENLRLPDASYDLVVSLAALHHIDNKDGFIRSVCETLTPGGFCCFADVAKTSGVSRFLDEFAGQYNGTGHRGRYLEIDTPYPGVEHAYELKLLEHALKPCPWLFNSQQDMIDFCRLLFDLRNVSDLKILKALETHIGFQERTNPQGRTTTCLFWELLYITFQKTPFYENHHEKSS